ncbi:MAG: hypothetical protein EBW87_03510 [Burkholderiaceae bacterium]|nr:hypothetical protein [Burkholderiaceae bacterium]
MHELMYYVDNGNPEQPISGVPVTDSGEPMDGLYDLLEDYSDTGVVIPFEHAVMARYSELVKVPQSIGGLDPVCTHIYTWPIPGTSNLIRYWFQPYTRD